MDLNSIANNIEKRENDIYFSKTTSEISYPEDGNQNCAEIEKDSFWFNHRNNVIIETVMQFCPKGPFFDIGGGNGFVSKGIQDKGIEVALVEPGKSGVLNARTRGVKNIICSTLNDAGFQNSSLKSVGLFDVVEHCEDDVSFLKNIYSYLEKDGYIFITVPAFNFLWSAHDVYSGHKKRYTLNGLKQVLIQCGFKTIYSSYIFSILPFLIFLFRSIPFRLGLVNESKKQDVHKKEHKSSSSKRGILSMIWRWELNKIKKTEKIWHGGSILLVAKKVSN